MTESQRAIMALHDRLAVLETGARVLHTSLHALQTVLESQQSRLGGVEAEVSNLTHWTQDEGISQPAEEGMGSFETIAVQNVSGRYVGKGEVIYLSDLPDLVVPPPLQQSRQVEQSSSPAEPSNEELWELRRATQQGRTSIREFPTWSQSSPENWITRAEIYGNRALFNAGVEWATRRAEQQAATEESLAPQPALATPPAPTPSTPDWRELLAIYVHAHRNGNAVPPHIDEVARAALATTPPAPTREAAPVPQQGAEISDRELLELMPQQLRDAFAEAARYGSQSTGGAAAPGVFRVVLNTHALDYARAVWARAQGARPAKAPPLPQQAEISVEDVADLASAVLAGAQPASPEPVVAAEISDEELAEIAGAANLPWEMWEDELLTLARAVWARAQGAMASPEPVVAAEISDEELLRTYGLAKQNHCYEGPIDDWPKRAERTATVCGLRAVLARYARPAIQPVMLSAPPWDDPWKRPGWRDREGRCWVGYPAEWDPAGYYASCSEWSLTDPTYICSRKDDRAEFAVVLPHWALPLPAADLPAADQQEGR